MPLGRIPTAGAATRRSAAECHRALASHSATSGAPGASDGVDLDVGAGERIALRRRQRQRQVDPRSAARRSAPTGSRATSRSVGDDPARLPRPRAWPAAPATCSRSRSGSSSRTSVADEVTARPGPRSARRGRRLMERPRPAARRLRGAQPVPALRRRAAAPVARLRARARTRASSCSTSRRSGRTASATRVSSRSSESASRRRLPRSPRRTTSASSADVAIRVVISTTAASRPTGRRRPRDPARSTSHDAQLDSALGRTSPLVKLGVALAWLIGLAFDDGGLAPARPVGGRARGPTRAGWPPGSARSAVTGAALDRGDQHRSLQHPVLGRERRPDGRRRPHAGPVPDHRGGAGGRGRARCAGSSRSRRWVPCSR